jgi:hypothetical protein
VLIDEVMPQYDVRERHARWMPADPADAYAAVKEVAAEEVRLFSPLMRLRTLGRSRDAFEGRAPLLEQMLAVGFVLLGERPGEEIVLAAIGRFWSPTSNTPRRIDDFAAFSEPGYAKAALNFNVVRVGAGSRVPTETRVQGTDAAASLKFRLYWLVIRLGSGAIRRSWLKAVERRLV